MPLNLHQAQAYVEARGDTIDRIRLQALLRRDYETVLPPSLATLQNPDGGFPYRLRQGLPSTLHHTAQVLDWLDDLGHGQSETARGAYAFLRGKQTLGGIWREDMVVRYDDAPLWMDPESAAADIYTTALCGATLLRDDNALLLIDRSVVWLQTQQGKDGLLHGFRLHASWLAVPVFAEILGEEARATRRLVSGLGRALTPEWTASMVAEMLRRLLDAGFSQRTEVVARGWELLQNAQREDGSFEAEETPEGDVAATLSVLQVARRLGRIGS
jgi:hypothetical protein